MNKSVYIVIPRLIKQPTWGGRYIARMKGLDDKLYANNAIGQSIELNSQTRLSLLDSTDSPEFARQIFLSLPDKSISLDKLTVDFTDKISGIHGMKKYRNKIQTLIKFTHALGNSFQLHIKPARKSGKWKAKPESWYFLEDGLATIGLYRNANTLNYQKALMEFAGYMKFLSRQIMNKSLDVNQARKMAKQLIKQKEIYKFVNTIPLKKGNVVDLTDGSIHHSWEEDKIKLPGGNIVYEVQMDVSDNQSTIRSFDKGKINDDGSIRQVHIKDYFSHLDSKLNQNPEKFIKNPKTIKKTKNYSVESVFSNQYYFMDKITFNNKMANNFTRTNMHSFHHLFCLEGKIRITGHNNSIEITQGHSGFIPAISNKYQLISLTKKSTVLKTYI